MPKVPYDVVRDLDPTAMQYNTYFFVAVAAPKRIAGYEAIPTVAEAGCPAGFEVGSWIALMEHAANPKPSLTKTLPKCYKNPLCASA